MSSFKAGFARVDITPPMGLFMQGYYAERRAEGVLDPLYGSVISVSDGEKTAVVFSIDVIGINQKVGDALRHTVAERTGLPYEAVYYACTHTHTGPAIYDGLYKADSEYNSVMFRKLADAAKEAIADLKPATVEIARSEAKNIAFIRRFKMKNGKTQTNPGVGNPEIDAPISTPDESVQLVRIKREDAPEILLVNFQVHPDVIGGSKYSADYPGFVRRAVEGALDGVKCIYFNGAQGDTNHINVFAPSSDSVKGYKLSRHMGLTIAGSVLSVYSKTEPVDCGKVDYIQYNLKVPSNRAPASALPLAEQYIKAHESGAKSEIPYKGMEYTTVVAEAYRIKRLADGPDEHELYLNAVRFGDVAFSGIPGEPFTDIGRGIKEGSPFRGTLVCCCANGSQAYFPMKSAYDEGGYEARSSSFKSGIAETIIEESVKMLGELKDAK